MKFAHLLLGILMQGITFSRTYAQQHYTITGKVTDANNAPLPVTARLLSVQDSSLITGAVFEDGNILIPSINHQQVLLKLTMLSFSDTLFLVKDTGEPIINLGTIVMKDQNQTFSEVKITGQLPLIKNGKDGSIEIQVQGTLLAGSSSVMELLERSPGLSVSEGRISFIGKGEAVIFLNGRPIAAEQLSAIAVNQILKVEILSNPSSRYDAEGKAVINIITKNHEKPGLLGSFTQQYSYSDFAGGERNTLADLNYVKNKLSFAGNFGLLAGNNREILYTTRTRPAVSDYLRSELKTDWQRKYENFWNVGLGAQYDVSERTNFSFSFRGNTDNQGGSQDSENELTTLSESSLYKSYIAKDEKRQNRSFILNYNSLLDTIGSAIFIGSQYTRYQTGTNDVIHENNQVGDHTTSKLIKNEVLQDIRISSTQADYTQMLQKGNKLEAGVKFSYAENTSGTDFLIGTTENEFQSDDELSSKFKYAELLPAGYLNYSTAIGKNLSLSIGLRGEWTQYRLNTTAGKGQQIRSDYFNLFPNILFNRIISDRFKVRASYVSKISRPRYQALNPFVIYQDPFTTIEGNPNLKPEKIHAFEFGANYGQLDFRTGFNYTRDPLSAAALRGSKPNSYVLKGINLQKDYTWLVSLSYATNISWWNTTNTITLTHSKSVDNQYDFAFVKPRPQVYLYSSNNFNVRNLFKIQLLAWYLGDRYYGLYYNKSRATVTLGLEKVLLKNTLTLRFTANDIFHQTNTSGTYSVGQTDIFFDRTYSINYFRLSATFRLGQPAKSRVNTKSTGESENNRAR